jgi:hypothetical protein
VKDGAILPFPVERPKSQRAKRAFNSRSQKFETTSESGLQSQADETFEFIWSGRNNA